KRIEDYEDGFDDRDAYAYFYNECGKLIPEPYSYTEKEVLQFFLYLSQNLPANTENEKIGIYLSALINYSHATDIYLPVNLIKDPLPLLGYRNKGRTVTIDGNCDGGIGYEMESGKLIIKGNVESDLGDHMKGGEIIIEGNTGVDTGFRMLGGIIRLEGEYISVDIDNFIGGEIYHKGKLKFKDGKKV
ncbi:MAG: hypothetical protein IH845_05105, partial [Nanoarchaeota archaeon]|nr:hypothetical protein [Nanoarchaeota archaeon]